MLTAAVTLAVAPPAPAQSVLGDGQGTLAVKLIDDRGRPSHGVVYVVGADGMAGRHVKLTEIEAPLDPGSSGLLAFTPWGGLQCVALAPCSSVKVELGQVVPDGSLDVTAANTTSVKFLAAPPATIAGAAQVGRAVRLVWSPTMKGMVKTLQALGPRVQWLRSGKVVRGATGSRYVVSAADVGKKLSARLTYPSTAVAQLKPLVGRFSSSRTTAAITVRG